MIYKKQVLRKLFVQLRVWCSQVDPLLQKGHLDTFAAIKFGFSSTVARTDKCSQHNISRDLYFAIQVESKVDQTWLDTSHCTPQDLTYVHTTTMHNQEGVRESHDSFGIDKPKATNNSHIVPNIGHKSHPHPSPTLDSHEQLELKSVSLEPKLLNHLILVGAGDIDCRVWIPQFGSQPLFV